ncbi:MAG: hypothetical protein ACI8RZ_004475 [Myxococcota bacterium]|jgi:hypothetical protein
MGLRQRLLARLRGQAPARPSPTEPPPPPSPPPGPFRLSDPALATLSPDDLDPALRAALADGRPEALDALLEVVHQDVYAVRILSEAWCDRMRAELDALDAWMARSGKSFEPPNSMNRYGVILSEIGMTEALEALMTQAIAPLAARCFPEVGGASLDDQHGFIVEYTRGGDRDLGFHVDDSEVTLNLCLGGEFSGGALYFEGRRCGQHRQTGCSTADRLRWEHRPGIGLLHAGKHRHGALPIEEGLRRNLILWCRSSAYRAAVTEECPPWCAESRAQ